MYVYDPANSFSDAYSSGMANMVQSNAVSIKGQEGNSLPFQVSFITPYIANNLLKTTGLNLSQMQEMIRAQGKPVSCEIKGITASVRTSVTTTDFFGFNVIGIIEGSDPVLKKECIIYTAHFDHVGKNEKGEILNGADDNANQKNRIVIDNPLKP